MRTVPFALIASDDPKAAKKVLVRLGLLGQDEPITSMTRAGEGNMNVVLRVVTPRRSLILKQSRPWVEKYPQIEAPADRILAEIDFYRRVEPYDAVRHSLPRLLGSDTEAHVLVLEDLGEANDYSDLYARQEPSLMPLRQAISWLATLHAVELDPSERTRFGNHALRRLNHAHVFVIPLQTPSAISLDAVCEGLEEVAREVRANSRIVSAAERLGACYLSSGDHLLHGDFYPGSWLRTGAGLKIIDPEFTFAGPIEFDLGVLAGHCVLVGAGPESLPQAIKMYSEAGGKALDESLLRGFAALEIIRRLIGVAQLPLHADLSQRTRMIQTAIQWIQ